MHPILFKVGPITIYSYGAMLALAFLIGISFASHRARTLGTDPKLIVDLSLYILIGALIGSRLLYVLTQWSDYRDNPLSVFKIWEGGLAFHGGLVGAVLISLWYLRRQKTSPWKVGDVIAPSVALGHALGRIGCFLNGCCYGKPTGLPWGITFPPGSFPARELGIDHSLHPVQLYSMLANFAIFVVLVRLTPRARFQGQIFWLYMLLYGLVRFGLEFFRAEHPPGWLSLTFYQLLSIGLFIFSVFMLNILALRQK